MSQGLVLAVMRPQGKCFLLGSEHDDEEIERRCDLPCASLGCLQGSLPCSRGSIQEGNGRGGLQGLTAVRVAEKAS